MYKRNQVEEAISRLLAPQSPEPSMELRTRLKRLLDTDRALGQVPRAAHPERANYAFYSAGAPGSGVEVWFSEYEAFALLNGLRLMGHGVPQGSAVSVLRRVRLDLEAEHTRILKLDAESLFDSEAIRRNAQEGAMAFDNTDPVLLILFSKSQAASTPEAEPLNCAIRRAAEAMQFVGKASAGGGACTMFELVGVAHRLSNALARTEPRHRGRG